MSKKVSKLQASERIHGLLKKEFARRHISVSYRQRLSIIMNGLQGKSNYRSQRELGVTEPTVSKWRDRWQAGVEDLESLQEEGLNGEGARDWEIIQEIRGILSDRPRRGTPKLITLAEEQGLLALATESPEDHGIAMTKWTHAMLAHVAVAKGIVRQISRSHVGNLLKKQN